MLFLHDASLREYGGVQGIKSTALLESALGRPMNRHAYADAGHATNLFDLAGAYAFGIAANHPFNDGNKRTAWACCVLFLTINRVALDVAAPEVVARMVALVAGEQDETGFASWLRNSAQL